MAENNPQWIAVSPTIKQHRYGGTEAVQFGVISCFTMQGLMLFILKEAACCYSWLT